MNRSIIFTRFDLFQLLNDLDLKIQISIHCIFLYLDCITVCMDMVFLMSFINFNAFVHQLQGIIINSMLQAGTCFNGMCLLSGR